MFQSHLTAPLKFRMLIHHATSHATSHDKQHEHERRIILCHTTVHKNTHTHTKYTVQSGPHTRKHSHIRNACLQKVNHNKDNIHRRMPLQSKTNNREHVLSERWFLTPPVPPPTPRFIEIPQPPPTPSPKTKNPGWHREDFR
jgi:hypothetical protein